MRRLTCLILMLSVACAATPTPQLVAVQMMYLPVVYSNWPPTMGICLSGPCAAVEKLGAEWYYNWGSSPCIAKDKRFVVMVWGRVRPPSIPYIVAMARATSGYLLGVNEPDQPTQANMTPGEGAEFHWQIQTHAEDVKLVSPAPSQDHPDWLWQMVDAYEQRYGERPRFDAIAAHYYAFSGDWRDTRDYLISIRQQALVYGYDVPIWLTEFGGECWTPNNHNEEIMRNLIPWMEAQPWIRRHAWFASMLPDPPATEDLEYCSLTSPETGKPTKLGELLGEIK